MKLHRTEYCLRDLCIALQAPVYTLSKTALFCRLLQAYLSGPRHWNTTQFNFINRKIR